MARGIKSFGLGQMRPLLGDGWGVPRSCWPCCPWSALVAAIALAVSIGEMAIPLATTVQALANRLFGAGFALSPIQEGIIWDYRLSRALVAACCGAALALSGAILQALLRNPLAEPYVLGISAGASTGAVAVMIAGLRRRRRLAVRRRLHRRRRWPSSWWRCWRPGSAAASTASSWPASPDRSCSMP